MIQQAAINRLHPRLRVSPISARFQVQDFSVGIGRWLHSAKAELDAARLPGLAERANLHCAAAAIEAEAYVGATVLPARVLPNEKPGELPHDRDDAALVVLRFTSSQSDRVVQEVDLFPTKIADFRKPHAGVVAERKRQAQIIGQSRKELLVLLALEESGPRRRLFEHREIRHSIEPAVLDRQIKHSAQR